MEHIVQFAIGIDDNAIVKKVEENAEQTIIKDIKQMVCNRLFESSYYNSNARPTDPLSGFTQRLVESFLEKNKEIILEKAAVHLADKLARSKAGKALLERVE